MLEKIDMNSLLKTAKKAGEETLKIYEKEFDVNYKDDNSPLTKADLASNEIICSFLEKNYPDIPIISEENKNIPYEIRKNWEYCWLIDPLDGTKEFIKRNGEFTINIALIHKQIPVLGIVYAPVLDEIYYAKKGEGAFKNETPLPIPQLRDTFKVVVSRSHLSDETKELIKELKTDKPIETVSKGSALKFCLMAEGSADLYPRLGPTMEWDTAAGDAICREVGRKTLVYETRKPLLYNKENLLNPHFIVY